MRSWGIWLRKIQRGGVRAWKRGRWFRVVDRRSRNRKTNIRRRRPFVSYCFGRSPPRRLSSSRDWVSPFFMSFRAARPSFPSSCLFFFSFLILPFSPSHRVTMRPGEDKQRGEGVKSSGKRCIDNSFGFLVCESSRGTGGGRKMDFRFWCLDLIPSHF